MTARGLAAALGGESCGWTVPSCLRSFPVGCAGVSQPHAPVRRLPPPPAPSPSAQADRTEPHAPVWRLPPPRAPSLSARAGRPKPLAPVRRLSAPLRHPRLRKPAGRPPPCAWAAWAEFANCGGLILANVSQEAQPSASSMSTPPRRSYRVSSTRRQRARKRSSPKPASRWRGWYPSTRRRHPAASASLTARSTCRMTSTIPGQTRSSPSSKGVDAAVA